MTDELITTLSSSFSRRVIRAPWTDDQVRRLNAYQNAGAMHPYTCGCPDPDRSLVATTDGWRCPRGCGHKQNWAFVGSLTEQFQHPPFSPEWCRANGVREDAAIVTEYLNWEDASGKGPN